MHLLDVGCVLDLHLPHTGIEGLSLGDILGDRAACHREQEADEWDGEIVSVSHGSSSCFLKGKGLSIVRLSESAGASLRSEDRSSMISVSGEGMSA